MSLQESSAHPTRLPYGSSAAASYLTDQACELPHSSERSFLEVLSVTTVNLQLIRAY